MAKPRRRVIRSWYRTLPEAQREALFGWMRKTGERAKQDATRSRALEAPAGAIAVGAGAFDPFLRSEGAQQYLSALRRGQTPLGALSAAQKWSKGAVDLHNAKRPRDYTWQRSQNSGGANLEALHRSLLTLIKERP